MKKVVALILTFIFIASSMTVLSGCSGDSGTLKEIPLSGSENYQFTINCPDGYNLIAVSL